MRKRCLGFRGSVVLFSAFVAVPVFFAQTRNRSSTEKSFTQDLKIKYRVDTQGQKSESTTMIKGARERDESHL